MFCRKCGRQNDDNAFKCVQCGEVLQSVPGAGARPTVPNHLVEAILVTLLCCVPFGVVAIVYAAQVNGKLAAGDYEGAVKASNNAKTWVWASAGVGLVVGLLYAVLVALGAVSGH